MDTIDILKRSAEEYQISLTSEQLSSFVEYYELLIAWNKKINLTALVTPQDFAVKHVIDSLSCYRDDIFKRHVSVIDVGTGAGFPGIPLKIFRPDINLTLLDSLNKRLLFLKEVIDTISLSDVELVHLRAEDGGKSPLLRQKFDIACSRAVAKLSVLAEYCLPFVRVDGYFVALKGAQYREEIDEARNAVKILGGEIFDIKPVKLPGLDDIRAVIYIKKVSNTSSQYPRKSGNVEKKPL